MKDLNKKQSILQSEKKEVAKNEMIHFVGSQFKQLLKKKLSLPVHLFQL